MMAQLEALLADAGNQRTRGMIQALIDEVASRATSVHPDPGAEEEMERSFTPSGIAEGPSSADRSGVSSGSPLPSAKLDLSQLRHWNLDAPEEQQTEEDQMVIFAVALEVAEGDKSWMERDRSMVIQALYHGLGLDTSIRAHLTQNHQFTGTFTVDCATWYIQSSFFSTDLAKFPALRCAGLVGQL